MLLIYHPVLHFDFIHLDDDIHVYENPFLHGWESLKQIWAEPLSHLYMPLTYTAWWFIAQLSAFFGSPMSPSWFHGWNLALHALNTVGIFVVLKQWIRRLEGDPNSERSSMSAWFGAAIFAIHPVQVESVAWVSAVKDPLAVSFFLASAGLLLANPAEWTPGRGGSRVFSRTYVAVTALFILALLSKPVSAIIPVLIGLLMWSPDPKVRLGWLKRMIPWVFASTLIFLLTKAIQPDQEIHFVAPIADRLWIGIDAISQHLVKIFHPGHLMLDNGRPPEAVLKDPHLFRIIATTSAALILAYFAGRRVPGLRMGLSIFLISLTPVLGLVPFSFQNYSTVSDHYLYLPMFGAALAVTASVHWILGFPRKQWVWFCQGAFVSLLMACMIASIHQLSVWKDSKAVFTHNLEWNPESYLAHYHLGLYHFDHREFPHALGSFRSAIRLRPRSLFAQLQIGRTLVASERSADAIQYLKDRLKNTETDPHETRRSLYAEMRTDLAMALFQQGRKSEALGQLHFALELRPGFQAAEHLLQKIGN